MFKQGDPSDLNNYRPISVISVIAKGFERIVYDQLYNFLTNKISFLIINRVFAHYCDLTATALLEGTDNVNAVVFLDLKKAFNTVDHDILLPKMNLYGKQGKALDWFKLYLTNR